MLSSGGLQQRKTTRPSLSCGKSRRPVSRSLSRTPSSRMWLIARYRLYASTPYSEPTLPPPFRAEAARIGSMCGALSRIPSRCAKRSSRSSRTLGSRAFASSTVKSLGKGGCTFWGSPLAARGQAVGEHVREAGGPYFGLRLLDVVLDEAVEDFGPVGLALGEHVGGESVPVARLSHRPGVHQVRPARAQVHRLRLDHGTVGRGGDGLDVRVAEKADADVRVLGLQQGQVLAGGGRVDYVLVRVADRAVDEERA